MMHRSNKSDVPNDEPSTSNIIIDVIAPVINENSINQMDDSNIFADSEFMDISFLKDDDEILKTQNPKQKDKKTKISSEHIEVMKAIEEINSTLKQVLRNQNKFINLW
ncbi:uncharacterized protein [Anoplolepis gracilipes]|uniref:uncharacterized protein n=1 Tax=Anoplolepis gracilipes TaxID=354296 RepID=UPI003B9F5749